MKRGLQEEEEEAGEKWKLVDMHVVSTKGQNPKGSLKIFCELLVRTHLPPYFWNFCTQFHKFHKIVWTSLSWSSSSIRFNLSQARMKEGRNYVYSNHQWAGAFLKYRAPGNAPTSRALHTIKIDGSSLTFVRNTWRVLTRIPTGYPNGILTARYKCSSTPMGSYSFVSKAHSCNCNKNFFGGF
jgi:hypothetical protein